MDNTETCENVVIFLRNLADSIENRTIEPQKLQDVIEFFVSYKFREHALIYNQEDEKIMDTDIDDAELIKFLVTGFYIYCLLKKKM